MIVVVSFHSESPTTTIMGSATVAIMEGDSTNIVCTSTGVLTPTIEWELLGSASLPFTPVDGTPLEPNITEVVPLEFTEGNLTSTFPITNAVFPDHDGMYRCTGTNAHNGVPATGAATAQITIQGSNQQPYYLTLNISLGWLVARSHNKVSSIPA